VTLTDELKAIAEEVVRHNYDKRVHIGLDYFDASINRIAAWTIGARNMYKALLIAMLEPAEQMRKAEESGDFTARLAWMEEAKSLPFAAVWDEYCRRAGVPVGAAWLDEVKAYEKNVLAKR
jgi:L-rhamnose isomerase